jgi:hypothetical protein
LRCSCMFLGWGAGRRSAILGVPAAPAARRPLPTAGSRSRPPLGKVLRALRAAEVLLGEAGRAPTSPPRPAELALVFCLRLRGCNTLVLLMRAFF